MPVALSAKPITISPLFQYSLQSIQNRITVKSESNRSIELWATYFQSHATTTSFNHNKKNMASLVFGASQWQIQDFVPERTKNPLLFLTYTPTCRLTRNGALIELRARQQWSNNIYFFLKAKMSYGQNKIIVKTYGSEFSPETATSNDLFQITNEGFAFRLDALSNLPLTSTGIGNNIAFVNYFDETFKEPGISMRGLLVTDAPLAKTPVIVEKKTPKQPPIEFSIAQSAGQTLPPLDPQKTLDQNEMCRFASLSNYTAIAQQSDLNTLWIMPTESEETLTPHAEKIKRAVQELIANETFTSTNAILNAIGIDLAPKKNRGFGGILLEPGGEMHISRHYIQNIYGIIILPAERTISDGNLFKIPIGNNGHSAIGAGTTLITPLSDPIITSIDCGYFYTIAKTEKMALPLKKSNLSVGPMIEAQPAWHTVYVNPNVSVTHYFYSANLLISVDYLAYLTSDDHINTPHLFFPEKAAFAIKRKEKQSKQHIQQVSITGSIIYNTPNYTFNVLLSIIRTAQAHNALFEKGWSITCGITF